MKKYIANIITGSRIIFSLPLLFIPLASAWFYVLYLFCGFTDMIDLNKCGIGVCVTASLAAIQESFYIATGYKNNEKIRN